MKSKNILIKAASISVTKSDEKVIRITFPFNQGNLTEIRTIPGRKWSKVNKYWLIPLSLENAFKLKEWKYTFSKELTEWANRKYTKKTNPITDIKIKELKGKLFDYQKEGVIFIENKGGRALIADEMGLGKTIQALAWLQLHKKKRPVIIICPASLKLNWEKEALNWIDVKGIQILSGSVPDRTFSTDIIIINYDIVTYWVSALKWLTPQVVILDEGHYIKNNSAKRTKAVKRLCKGVPNVLVLTGTPIESKPVEIYNCIDIIDRSIFPDKWGFLRKYCDAKHNGFGWNFNGASNVKELHNILTNKVMLRRKKKDVLKDLPDKIYSTVPLEIDNKKEYDLAEQDFVNYVKSGVEIKVRERVHDLPIGIISNKALDKLKNEAADKATVLTQIEALKQLAVKGKLEAIIKWIDNFLQSGEKLIIFGTHKFFIDALMKKFSKLAVKIDGSVSTKKRQEAVDQFQTNKRIRLFVGNIKAAGVGLTLTAASNVAIAEFPWTPGERDQAIDRAHRIGQKFTVNAYSLVGVNTIDEKIIKLLDKKQQIVEGVLDGKNITDFNIISELIESYK